MIFNKLKDNLRSLAFAIVSAYLLCFSSFATLQIQQPSQQFFTLCQNVMQFNPLSKDQIFIIDSKPQDLINKTVMGRNLMVVEDNDGCHVIVTGIGPRYHSGLKAQIQNIFGCQVLDLVDLLPLEQADVIKWNQNVENTFQIQQGEQKNQIQQLRTMIRDLPWIYKYAEEALRSMQKLPENLQQNQEFHKLTNITKTVLNDALKGLQGIQFCKLWLNKLNEIDFLDNKGDLKLSREQLQKLNNLKNKLQKLKELNLEDTVKKAINLILNKMLLMFTELQQYQSSILKKNVEQSIQALQQKFSDNFLNEVKELCSITSQNIPKDMSNIQLSNKFQQYALAHFSHSEQLAVYWSRHFTKTQKPYFFTQRGMCETCNPFVIQCVQQKFLPHNFYVFSQLEANRPTRPLNTEINFYTESSLEQLKGIQTNFQYIQIQSNRPIQFIYRIKIGGINEKQQEQEETKDEPLKEAIEEEKQFFKQLQ